MRFKDSIRVMSFSVYLDETSLYSLIVARDFLIENRHPDTQLSIKIKTDNIEYKKLYDATSIFNTLNNISLTIESRFDKVNFDSLEFIKDTYHKIIIDKKDYRKEDEALIYLAANNKNVVVNYIIDENNTELYEFKKFYDILAIPSSYKIDFYSKINNKKEFVNNVLEQFNLILKDNNNYIYNINYSDPRKNLMLKEDKIVYSEYDDFWAVDKIDYILSKRNLDMCKGCVAINYCEGGDYPIIENTDNGDVFCAINMGIVYLKEKYLKELNK